MAKKSNNAGRGPSTRQLRVGELLRRTLSEILTKGDIHDPDLNRIPITVGEVRISPDLTVATAFVLPLGGGQREEALSALRKNRHEIRRTVGKAMALKHTPEIRFLIDTSFDRMDETRRLLDQPDVRRDIDKTDDETDTSED